ncbi:hypothetical protein [Iodobacter sp.]|uniref:hypothetical protein n=1 Tax=Iodobacter sp. TaxID=1915058 RepID=UPI002600FA23|nr:hypothetical protein [Iodobacter sp.]
MNAKDWIRRIKELEGIECLDLVDDDGELVVEESAEWISEGKYETGSLILHVKGTELYFCVSNGRSGSYYTDWYYNEDPDVVQVQPKETTVTRWVPVNA